MEVHQQTDLWHRWLAACVLCLCSGAASFAQTVQTTQGPPAARSDLSAGTQALVGQWAGEVSSWGEMPRRIVVNRKADGRFEMKLTLYEAKGQLVHESASGSWAFTNGILELKPDGRSGPPASYRVMAEAFGCLMLQSLDPVTLKTGPSSYEYMECPHPSRWPQEAQVDCWVQLGSEKLGGAQSLHVQIRTMPDGRRRAQMDGTVSNEDTETIDHPVRATFSPNNDPLSAINPGESSLYHLFALANDKELDLGLKVPFRWGEVRMVRTYELEPGSRTNKFGGTVLFEPFGKDGRSLGKYLRAMLVAPCKP